MFCPPQPLRLVWITPAYAGKRRSDWIIRSIYWDHPRVCGEKLAAKAGSINGMGSPPRVRGKAFRVGLAGRILGITPACAGKSSAAVAARICAMDHPRMCGEKAGAVAITPFTSGSSPRVRGKGLQAQAGRLQGRITPACAGKRQGRAQFWWPAWDHPRMCGEKALKSWLMSGDVGSPPRVRGKVSVRAAWRPYHGITPACAGKRLMSSNSPTAQRDHPRVCGEKRHLSSISDFVIGSPPRVRGKVPSSI